MPSKNIPVNGWPQIKELDTVAPILAELDKIETWQKSVKQETKSGAFVEFTNALALDASSVIAEITAVQDLHGYDKPWVGGAGKNKLENNNAQNAEVNGITVTVDSLGVIDLDGTATANTFIYTQGTGWGSGTPPTTLVNGQTYTLGYGHTDAEMGSMRLALYGLRDNDTVFSACADVSAPFTHQFVYDSSITSFFAYIRIMNGTHLDHFKLYPQIEQGTSETAFAPYSNICPITGFSSVTITDVDAESHTATVTVALGQTVYGGSLDLTSGELTITHANVTLDGSEDEVWDVSANRFRCKSLPTNCIDSASTINGISNLYEANTADNIFANRQTANFVGFAISKTELLVVDNVNFATDDLSAFKTFLASNNLQVVYTLATPTTTTLTAEQLEMVKGYNRISANSGNIEVTAYTGNTWN